MIAYFTDIKHLHVNLKIIIRFIIIIFTNYHNLINKYIEFMKTRFSIFAKFMVLAIIIHQSPGLLAQAPGTEVILFDLETIGTGFKISNPINISLNKGYDNQPYFLPDGSGLLYSSAVEDGNTEIILYKLDNKEKKQLTRTPGSEYSPTVTPDRKYFTSILLEKDGTQLLWKYNIETGKAEIAVEGLKIGYHCWYDRSTIVSFVLGDTITMQISNLTNGKNKIVTKNIRRSLHKIPLQEKISFIQQESDGIWMIKWLNPETGESGNIVQSLNNSQDMAWSPTGGIIMGQENKLFFYKPESSNSWIEFADLEEYGYHGITRIAISPKANKVAVVVNEN